MTDGQTERREREIEKYKKCFTLVGAINDNNIHSTANNCCDLIDRGSREQNKNVTIKKNTKKIYSNSHAYTLLVRTHTVCLFLFCICSLLTSPFPSNYNSIKTSIHRSNHKLEPINPINNYCIWFQFTNFYFIFVFVWYSLHRES